MDIVKVAGLKPLALWIGSWSLANSYGRFSAALCCPFSLKNPHRNAFMRLTDNRFLQAVMQSIRTYRCLCKLTYSLPPT